MTRKQLAEKLRRSPFKSDAGRLMKLAVPSVRIATKRKRAKPGQSRFGGEPGLPADFAWPKSGKHSMSFLCQINFAEVPRKDIDGALPRGGQLYLFYDEERGVWGFDPKDRTGWHVAFVPGDAPLKRRPLPEDLIDRDHNHPESVLTFQTQWMLPTWDWEGWPPDLARAVREDDKLFDTYEKLWGQLGLRDNQHRLVGYPQPVQGDMRLECQLVTHGLYCGDGRGYDDPRARALARGVRQWRLLLQIDTDETNKGPGWMWGDCGRLYLMIRDRDLKKRAFDQAWLILQCG